MGSPMPGVVEIRPMQYADLDQVRLIDELSFSLPWPASAYNYELNHNPASLQWVAEVVDEYIQKDDFFPEATAHARLVVGMIVIWLILDEAHIATLATHPDYRRQGIAAQLLAVALKAAANKGMIQATLEVRAGNLGAQALYRHFGFVEVGKRPRYYKDNNEDALIMTVTGLSSETHVNWWKGSIIREPERDGDGRPKKQEVGG
jgi:[ribosomal protein S18]-alanine N-acetyltransferase